MLVSNKKKTNQLLKLIASLQNPKPIKESYNKVYFITERLHQQNLFNYPAFTILLAEFIFIVEANSFQHILE